jgi:pimeloyl-ACP methyl ester carboxylesterase
VSETGPAVETTTVVLRGVRHRVHLLRVGDRTDPWLGVLHEGLGSIPQWRSFPGDLAVATGLNALIYERRNHGGSGLLPKRRGLDYHSEEAEIYQELLTTVGIDRVVTYGHSDGATIALLHAAAHPNRVAAVVSEAGHVIAEDVARRGIQHAKRRYSTGLRAALVRHHGDHTDAMFHAWADTWLDPMFENWDITAKLATATAPVLILQGRNDEYAVPEHVDWIAAAVAGPNETWLLDGVGHTPHREAGGAVIVRVVEFLKRHGVLSTKY